MTGMRTFVMIHLRQLLLLVLLFCSLVGCAAPGKSGVRQGADGTSALSSEALFALSRQADSAYRAQRWPEAAAHYQRLTDAVPKDAWSWFRLGNVRTQQGDYAAAIQAYSVSVMREGKTAKPWFNLSTAYLLNARKSLVQASQLLAPGDPAHVSIRVRMDAIDAVMLDASVDVSDASSAYGEIDSVGSVVPAEPVPGADSGWTPVGRGAPEQ